MAITIAVSWSYGPDSYHLKVCHVFERPHCLIRHGTPASVEVEKEHQSNWYLIKKLHDNLDMQYAPLQLLAWSLLLFILLMFHSCVWQSKKYICLLAHLQRMICVWLHAYLSSLPGVVLESTEPFHLHRHGFVFGFMVSYFSTDKSSMVCLSDTWKPPLCLLGDLLLQTCPLS